MFYWSIEFASTEQGGAPHHVYAGILPTKDPLRRLGEVRKSGYKRGMFLTIQHPTAKYCARHIKLQNGAKNNKGVGESSMVSPRATRCDENVVREGVSLGAVISRHILIVYRTRASRRTLK